jgi:hypothetical protein
VVVVEVSKQTKAKFLYEYQVLRLARAGGSSVRFAIDPAGRAQWGDPPFTGVRVGPDGQLYQLRTSRTSGVDIARYSLQATTPPTTAPAPSPPVDQGGQTAPNVSLPPVTVPPAQPATPAANPVAAHPATSRWVLPSLAALAASLLAGASSWLLYRRRHPTSPDLHDQSQVAR